MSDERIDQAKQVVLRALDRPPADRAAFVAAACGGDAALLADVEAYLAADAAAGTAALRPGGDGRDDAATVGPGPAAAASVDAKPGDRVGPYKLLEQIGAGGFGVVFMAEQERPVRRRVALKVIKLGMDTKEVVARFDAERQALAMMDHPNIARVLDAGATAAGCPYFVMELVRGSPITDFADKHKLSTRDRVALAAQVCRAVQHAHAKGVIHRDLKPSNVLVTVTDDKPVPKVIDFGIAKATQSKLTDRTLFTGYRQLIGTPQYMSPEQADSDGSDIDTRTDVYSLGVLIYELLVGTTPLDVRALRSAAFEAMRRMIRETEPAKPSTRLSALGDTLATVATNRGTDARQLSRQLHGELDWVVMRALEKDRARRYDTAAALADDLGRHLAGEAVLAGPVSGAYRLRKALKRYKAAVVIGMAIAACLLLGVAGTTAGLVEARTKERRALASERDAKATLAFFTDDVLAKVSPRTTRDHAACDLMVHTLIEPAIRTVGQRFGDQPLVKASVQEALAEVTLNGLRRPDLAEGLAKAAWDARRRLLGDENPDTLAALVTYAAAINGEGHNAEAEGLLKHAWDASRRVSGDDSRATLNALGNYALAVFEQGRNAEAGELWKRQWDASRRVLGEDDHDTYSALNNYASALMNQSRNAEAKPLLKRAWESRRRVSGDDDPDTLFALQQYAWTFEMDGDHAAAEPLLKQCWDASRRVLGDENPDTLTVLNRYAQVVNLQGRHAEAEPLLKHGLDISRRALGEDNFDTLKLLGNYALAIDGQGRQAESEQLLKQVWDGSRRGWGDDNFDTLTAMSNYAEAVERHGRGAEAESLFKQVWDARRRVLGEDHPATLVALNRYANAIYAEGRYAVAEPLFKRCWDVSRRVLGDDHPITITVMSNDGNALTGLGRYAEAATVFKQAWERSRRALGDAAPDSLIRRASYATALLNDRRFADAEPFYRQDLKGQRGSSPRNEVAVANSASGLGRCLARMGPTHAAEAESLLREAVSIRSNQLGPHAGPTTKSAGALADLLDGEHRPAEAATVRAGAGLTSATTRSARR